MPDTCDWYIWRLLTSQRIRGVTMSELEKVWSLDDIAHAHWVLDEIESAEAEAYEER